jgi:hypothetical protein
VSRPPNWRLGVEIEQLYGMRWISVGAGGWALRHLAARPITALPEPPSTAEVEAPLQAEWKVADPRSRFARGSTADFLPDPLSPLFDTLARPIYNAGLKSGRNYGKETKEMMHMTT